MELAVGFPEKRDGDLVVVGAGGGGDAWWLVVSGGCGRESFRFLRLAHADEVVPAGM